MPTTYPNPSALLDAAGTDLGTTEWFEVTQERVDQFAEATLDHQWIHVDPARAKDSPFGGTIAHGYLTLSLCSHFLPQLLRVEKISMGINYGLNKVRFIAPVRVGNRIRARGEVLEVTEVRGGAQIVVKITVEAEGVDKPAAVVESVSRFLD